MRLQASRVINQEFGGQPNFMTPNVLEYGWIKDQARAYELSSGRGIFTDIIYGVSIVDVTWTDDNGNYSLERSFDDSKGGFYTEKEARDYIESLK